MAIVDPLLPAAVHLTGPDVADVLRPAIERAGGRLRSQRCSQLHYRPGHDLVARFRAEVEWGDGLIRRETVFAATTSQGPPPGTLVVTADSADTELAVGVWRWPFDPVLPALEPMLTSTADRLAEAGAIDASLPIDVDVVAHRPMERAVVRVRAPSATWYLKVVRPADAARIIHRHQLVGRHGLPVPEVVASDAKQGWLLTAELAGPTLRDLVKADAPAWVEPDAVRDLIRRVASIEVDDLPSLRSRLGDAAFHTSLLSRLMPGERDRLDRLGEFFEAESARERPQGFVHGDLHERQIIVDDGRIVGLLDIDEAGLGDPVDDVAVPAAHLRYRALSAPNRTRITGFADALVTACGDDHDRRDIAAGTAAVLAGLATTPFRARRNDWRGDVARALDLIESTLPRA